MSEQDKLLAAAAVLIGAALSMMAVAAAEGETDRFRAEAYRVALDEYVAMQEEARREIAALRGRLAQLEADAES